MATCVPSAAWKATPPGLTPVVSLNQVFDRFETGGFALTLGLKLSSRLSLVLPVHVLGKAPTGRRPVTSCVWSMLLKQPAPAGLQGVPVVVSVLNIGRPPL